MKKALLFLLASLVIFATVKEMRDINSISTGKKPFRLFYEEFEVSYVGDEKTLVDFVRTTRTMDHSVQAILTSLTATSKTVIVAYEDWHSSQNSQTIHQWINHFWSDATIRKPLSDKLVSYRFEAYNMRSGVPIRYVTTDIEKPRVEFLIYDTWLTRIAVALGCETIFTHEVTFYAKNKDLDLIRKLHR
jgi:hypothetical protein